MIDLPEGFLKHQFKEIFVRGALFHCENYNFDNGTVQNKFIFVLNGCDENGQAYFYLPTSKVDKWQQIASVSNMLVIIPEGTVKNLPVKTVIRIRPPEKKDFHWFESRFIGRSTDKLMLCDPIPDSILQLIWEKICASDLISLAAKKKILPPQYIAK